MGPWTDEEDLQRRLRESAVWFGRAHPCRPDLPVDLALKLVPTRSQELRLWEQWHRVRLAVNTGMAQGRSVTQHHSMLWLVIVWSLSPGPTPMPMPGTVQVPPGVWTTQGLLCQKCVCVILRV